MRSCAPKMRIRLSSRACWIFSWSGAIRPPARAGDRCDSARRRPLGDREVLRLLPRGQASRDGEVACPSQARGSATARRTNPPPRASARLAAFLANDWCGTLKVPPEDCLRPPALALEAALRHRTSTAVRDACAAFLLVASDFYRAPWPG